MPVAAEIYCRAESVNERKIVDTKHNYVNRNINLDNIEYNEKLWTDERIELFRNYVKITEEIQELHQLFNELMFNLGQLDKECIVYYNDQAVLRDNSEPVDFTIINALTINILSSGRSLIDYMETILKNQKKEKYVDFKKNYISKVFDEEFSYKLCYYLRNYSQHGHMPVSVKEDMSFYEFTKQSITQKIMEIKIEIEKNPSIVQSRGLFKNFIIYDISNNEMHAFNVNDNFEELFMEYYQESKDEYTKRTEDNKV